MSTGELISFLFLLSGQTDETDLKAGSDGWISSASRHLLFCFKLSVSMSLLPQGVRVDEASPHTWLDRKVCPVMALPIVTVR